MILQESLEVPENPVAVDLLGRERTPIAVKLIAPPWRSLRRGSGDFFGRELWEKLQPPPPASELWLARKKKHEVAKSKQLVEGRLLAVGGSDFGNVKNVAGGKETE